MTLNMADLRAILQDIEAALKNASLWQESEVDPKLLQSSEPFCCDTLSFEQWLQFVLLPKMHALLTQKLPLPTKVAIAPMGEYVWANQADKLQVLEVLLRFDQYFEHLNQS